MKHLKKLQDMAKSASSGHEHLYEEQDAAMKFARLAAELADVVEIAKAILEGEIAGGRGDSPKNASLKAALTSLDKKLDNA